MGTRCSCPQTLPSHCCISVADAEESQSGELIGSISVLDWGTGNEPMGQVFQETVQHLSSLDRQLLHFCASSNLVAVRWLVHLGACLDSNDANGTTCLHVACRTGCLAIVTEVLRSTNLVDSSDVAGWTPLHIAAHMGRRECAARLLRARASPQRRNARGQRPLDLCVEPGTLEALRGGPGPTSASSSPRRTPTAPVFLDAETAGGAGDDSVGMPNRCEPECFFVNPEPVFLGTQQHRKGLLQLAAIIFNLRPTYGAAFSVASGLTDSYTGAVRLLLQHGGICRMRFGRFLGDAFSLCSLLRFSVFECLALQNTGVLSALGRALSVMQLPEDLQRIDRILCSLAHVWWRKHNALLDGHVDTRQQPRVPTVMPQEPVQPRPLHPPQPLGVPVAPAPLGPGPGPGPGPDPNPGPQQPQPQPPPPAPVAQLRPGQQRRPQPRRPGQQAQQALVGPGELEQPELVGLDLMQYLVGSNALCQLMVSSVLLHWYIHGRGDTVRGRTMPFEEWAALNRGIEAGGADVPEHVQRRIYDVVCRGFRQELALAAPGEVPRQRAGLSACASMEGWVRLLNGALPYPEAAGKVGAWEHASTGLPQGPLLGGLAEARASTAAAASPTASGGAAGPGAGAEPLDVEGLSPGGGAGPAHGRAGAGRAASRRAQSEAATWSCSAATAHAGSPTTVWASLCGIFLFFALAPGCESAAAPYAATDARHLRVAGVAAETRVITLQAAPAPGGASNAGLDPPHIVCAVLLSDGRWQQVCLPKIELQVATAVELDAWVAHLVKWPADQPQTV